MAHGRAGHSFASVRSDSMEGSRMNDRPLTIRMATPADARTLTRLATLDSARPLAGRVLLAEADGAPIAAISLGAGAVTADPFEHTADAVRLLRLRRYQLLHHGAGVGRAPTLVRRLVPGPAS